MLYILLCTLNSANWRERIWRRHTHCSSFNSVAVTNTTTKKQLRSGKDFFFFWLTFQSQSIIEGNPNRNSSINLKAGLLAIPYLITSNWGVQSQGSRAEIMEECYLMPHSPTHLPTLASFLTQPMILCPTVNKQDSLIWKYISLRAPSEV